MSSTFGDGGVNAGLVSIIQQTVAQILADPTQLPAEFKGWLPTYLEANPPLLPASQIFGLRQNTVQVYKKSTAVVTVANTTSLSPIMSEQIPGGSMGTTGAFRVTLEGEYLNNTGAGRGLQHVISFGGSPLIDTGSPAIFPPTTSIQPWRFMFTVTNQASAVAQYLRGGLEVVIPVGTLIVTGSGSWSPDGGAGFSATSSIDTTVAQSLVVQVAHTAASANLSLTMRQFTIEFL